MFVSVAAIVTAPPDSEIVILDPAVNASVSLEAKVLPPAVIVLTESLGKFATLRLFSL